MPDPNNPLETALREIREAVGTELNKCQMTQIRATCINLVNKSIEGTLNNVLPGGPTRDKLA